MTQRAIDELIAPLCVGRDATRIAPLMHDVRAKLHVFGQGFRRFAPLTKRPGLRRS